MSDRENFEEAASRLGFNLTMAEHETGEYHYQVTQDAWDIWQEATYAAAREQEAVGFVQSDGLSFLKRGHPAKIYPVGAAPSPFEKATKVYAHPPQSQGVPEGWKLVPIASTSEMDIAAHDRGIIGVSRDEAEIIWNVMLAAAPQPPQEGEGDE